MCCFGIIPPHQKKPTAKMISSAVLENLKEIYPFLTRLDLVGGELFDIPFEINPLVQVLRDIAASNASKLRLTITTNGQHLTKRWAEFILEFPFIDIIAISVDSFDPTIYAHTRVMGSLDRVRQSIDAIHAAKAARGLLAPLIRLNSILGVHTHEGISHFVENAKALGATEIEFQKLVLMGHPEFFAENNLFQPHHVDKLRKVWRDLAAVDFRSNAGEIIGMVEAYLAHIGARDAAVASDEHVPFCAQYSQDSYVFPVGGPNEVSQNFIASRNSVSRIKFVPGTLERRNSCDVVVAVEDGTGTLTSGKINAASLVDNAWTTVKVPRITLDVGREYRLVIRSPESPGNHDCIAVRCSEKGDGMVFNGVPRPGQLAHMVFLIRGAALYFLDP
jgi:sulfatase maturation enzyme AslB (radical SAM superfamily)